MLQSYVNGFSLIRPECNDDASSEPTLLLLDDCPCVSEWCVDVTTTWNKLKQMELIEELGTYESEDKARGLCWGYYNKKVSKEEFESKAKKISMNPSFRQLLA